MKLVLISIFGIHLFIAFYSTLVNNYVLYISKELGLPNLIIEFNLLFLASALVFTPILFYLKNIIGKKRIIVLSLINFLGAIAILFYGIYTNDPNVLLIGGILEGITFSVLFPLLNSVIAKIDGKNLGKNLGNIDIIWILIAVFIPIIIIYISMELFILITAIHIISILGVILIFLNRFDEEALKAYKINKLELRNLFLFVIILLSLIYGIVNLQPIFIILAAMIYLIVYLDRFRWENITILKSDRKTILFTLLFISILILYIPINLFGWILMTQLNVSIDIVLLIISINTLISAIAIRLASKWLDEKDYHRLVGTGIFIMLVGGFIGLAGLYILSLILLSFGINIIGPVFIRKLLLDVQDDAVRDKNSTDYMFILRLGTILSMKFGYIIVEYLGLWNMTIILIVTTIVYYLIVKYKLFPTMNVGSVTISWKI
ncbi:MAG: MFS transporter [Candidatus Anstonellales archaeon]